MTVSITWATTPGGDPVATPINHSQIANGDESTPQSLYISHNGDIKITSVGLYIRAYSGGDYPSSGAGADADYNELIAWGGLTPPKGFQMEYPAEPGAWIEYKADQGTVDIPIILSTKSGVSIAGEITPSEEAHIRVKICVSGKENTPGYRHFDQCLSFISTS